ncbi:transmembrane 220 family protein [Sedimentitalea sp. JM2-8]|uniref:Transmembrane 220 family protein n=1 Tax=Sedimentitalea xiamensis TaxID=3050037 RepID=A0ABT7FH72_9RHOB|nr:transmembrane 220 family protein [Sedimentitalea xiamensis]MDK3074486.1 transmembrane 220 family protein [Sedimentitalea xiamensis]
MRIVNAVLCLLMALFAVVQYNDPDALFWGAIYGVAAIWCGFAAFRPGVFETALVRGLLTASVTLSAFGVAWFWPRTEGFWHMDVWWETETAREGMGMMIVLLAVAVAWLTVRPRRRAL